MKSHTVYKAIALANLICPAGWHDEEDLISEEEVRAQLDITSAGINKVRQLTNLMEPTRKDLQLIRAMLAAEFFRSAPRLPVVMLLINRHETLYKLIRLDKLMIELPEIAVEIDRGMPKPPAAPMQGASLQTAITGALHGKGGEQAVPFCQVDPTCGTCGKPLDGKFPTPGDGCLECGK